MACLHKATKSLKALIKLRLIFNCSSISFNKPAARGWTLLPNSSAAFSQASISGSEYSKNRFNPKISLSAFFSMISSKISLLLYTHLQHQRVDFNICQYIWGGATSVHIA